jgi:hypothetical protein
MDMKNALGDIHPDSDKLFHWTAPSLVALPATTLGTLMPPRPGRPQHQGSAIHQRAKHVGARWIADECRDLGDF